MSKIEVGSVVTLQSDMLRMTVTRIEGDTAHCVWSVKGEINSQEIPLVALRCEAMSSGKATVFLKRG